MPALYRILYWCLYFSFKVGFLFSGYNLFSEEAQYWLWGKHPDWAYYSKPPLIAWVNYITSNLFGDHELVIRLTALGLGAATLYLFYKVGMLLFASRQLAHLATMLLSIMPYFVLASTFFTTDSLLLFFWVCTFFFFLKALKYNTLRYWLATGISLGLGALSKQAMLFFVLPLLWPVSWSQGRRYLPGQTLVLLLALLFHLPIFWWNYRHDWVMLGHMLDLSGLGQNLQPSKSWKYLGEFFGGFILINSPFYFPLLLRTLLRGRQQIQLSDKQKLELITLPAIGCLIGLSLIAFNKRIEVNWFNTGCMLLPIGMAYLIIRDKRHASARLSFSLTSLCLVLLLYPIMQDYVGMNRILPVRQDALKRLVGWQKLGEQTLALTTKYVDLAPLQLVAVDYHVASELAFYTGNHRVRSLGGHRENQFSIWEAEGWGLKRENALFVTDNPRLPEEVNKCYNILEERRVPFEYRGETLYTYTIYVLRAKADEGKEYTAPDH